MTLLFGKSLHAIIFTIDDKRNYIKSSGNKDIISNDRTEMSVFKTIC